MMRSMTGLFRKPKTAQTGRRAKRLSPFASMFASLRPRLALVLLLASALQSYITQTHIHAQTFSAFGAYTVTQTDTQTAALNSGALEIAGQLAPAQKQNPLEEPATCPIYNEMLCSGHYLAPATGAVAIERDIASRIVFSYTDSTSRKAQLSYGWQGRAPPIV